LARAEAVAEFAMVIGSARCTGRCDNLEQLRP